MTGPEVNAAKSGHHARTATRHHSHVTVAFAAPATPGSSRRVVFKLGCPPTRPLGQRTQSLVSILTKGGERVAAVGQPFGQPRLPELCEPLPQNT